MSRTNYTHCLLLLAAIGSVGMTARAQELDTRYRGNTASVAHADSLSDVFRTAAEKVLPAVVKVRTTSRGDEALIIRGFGIPVEQPKQEGLGSGVIIDSRGIVLTNNHVVKSAEEIVVELQDGTLLYGTEFATDPLTDLAIVRVKAMEPLPTAVLGQSEELEIGDWVLAIGYPLDLETSVSAGIISAKGRSLSRIPRAQFLQTDAAINPGNSGGPLVNLRGEVIGINTAIASQTGGYQGIGFAIPTSLARDVVRQLVETGEVRRGYLGVTIQELTRDLSEQLGNEPGRGGVLVNDVAEGTPAKTAGIQPGDVITRFAGEPVDSPASLQRAVERVPIGSSQQLNFVRFGKPLSVAVSTLEFSRTGIKEDLRGVSRQLVQPNRNNSTLGFVAADLRELARKAGYDIDGDAVIITRVDRDGLAAAQGLRPGMLVRQVREQRVGTMSEFNTALAKESLSDGVLLMVEDPNEGAGAKRFVVLRARQ